MLFISTNEKMHLMVATLCFVFMSGCTREQKPSSQSSRTDIKYNKIKDLESVDFYERKLLDDTFQWHGPCSNETGIPRLHAARTLAYIGDPAVPALFRACKNEKIDYASVFYSIQEIGLPANEYLKEERRHDIALLEKWWAENKEATVRERSEYRMQTGLPPIEDK